MTNINGMRPPFQIFGLFLLYANDVLIFYSTTMLINEFLFSIVVSHSIVEHTNNYKGSFVHGGMGMSCTWMNGDFHK